MSTTIVRPLVRHKYCPCGFSMPADGVDVTETMPGRFMATSDLHCPDHGNVRQHTRIVRHNYGPTVMSSDFTVQGSFFTRV